RSPACSYLVVSASSKTVACDGTSTYHGNLSIDGPGRSNVRSANVSTGTDNVIVIELVGSPYDPSVCDLPKSCYQQDFKAHRDGYNPDNTKGNILWTKDILW